MDGYNSGHTLHIDEDMEDQNGRLGQVAQLNIENARRIEGVEKILEMLRFQHQGLESSLAQIVVNIEILHRDLSALAGNNIAIVRLEEQMQVVRAELEASKQANMNLQNMIKTAIIAALASGGLAALWLGIKDSISPPAPIVPHHLIAPTHLK